MLTVSVGGVQGGFMKALAGEGRERKELSGQKGFVEIGTKLGLEEFEKPRGSGEGKHFKYGEQCVQRPREENVQLSCQ